MARHTAWARQDAAEKHLIIYHSNCPDGTCAAAVALRALPGATAIPALYGDAPPDVSGLEVYVVDFSYPRNVLFGMRERARSLTILDHHKSAAEDLAGFPGATFDMNRSGAGITWDHFFPGEDRPWIVAYVEDRDLWRYDLPDSRAINAWISTLPLNEPEAWSKFLNGFPMDPHLTLLGQAILAYQKIHAERVATTAERGSILGYDVPVVNAAYPLGSNVLEILYQGEEFAARWQRGSDGLYAYSVASGPDNLDVSTIAREFGGGGHEHAAGFVSDELVHLS